MKISFLGDVHAKHDRALKAIEGINHKIVQVGDFGVGFGPIPDYPSNFKFIRGNHDDPAKCLEIDSYIGCNSRSVVHWGSRILIFAVEGAESIDKDQRTMGIDWWPDEQPSYNECQSIIDLYKYLSCGLPVILVSHSEPSCIGDGMGLKRSRTSLLLQELIEIKPPVLHVFGHIHRDMRKTIGKTNFIGLPELGLITTDTDYWVKQ